ncbi:hypothetical protein DUNSADRAFT_12369, partial [Dunaliella salina]
GPREDIIVPLTLASNGVGGFLPPDDYAAPQPPNGFLANSVQEFTDAIFQLLIMDQAERLTIAAAAQAHVSAFRVERFMSDFMAALEPLVPLPQS